MYIEQCPMNIHLTSHTAQCSNKLCRETRFYSDPLDQDVAEYIITTLKNSPSFPLTGLLSASHSLQPHRRRLSANTNTPQLINPVSSNMNLSQLVNPVSSNINQQSNLTSAVPQALSRKEVLSSLERRDGGTGIRCGNLACVNKSNMPRPGHKECTGYFCQQCCVESVRQSMEKCEAVTRCAVRSHLMAAGLLNSSTITTPEPPMATQQHLEPTVAALTTIGSYKAPPSIVTMGKHLAGPTIQATPPRDDELLIGPTTNHAMPNPVMWQRPTHGWLREKREAAALDAGAVNYKKAAAETKFLQRSAVSVAIWHSVSH